MPDAILSRTETIAGCPKYCGKCGNQGQCVDSRRRSHAIMRAYKCRCGHRWTTAETLIEDGVKRHDPRKFRHHQERERLKAITHLQADFHAAVDSFFKARSISGEQQ